MLAHRLRRWTTSAQCWPNASCLVGTIITFPVSVVCLFVSRHVMFRSVTHNVVILPVPGCDSELRKHALRRYTLQRVRSAHQVNNTFFRGNKYIIRIELIAFLYS